MKNYEYKNSSFWIQYMKPSEIVYLILFTCAKHRSDNYLLDGIVHVDGDTELDSKAYDRRHNDDEGHGEFDTTIGYTDIEISVQLEGEYSYSYTKYYHGTHYDPPEGGDFILDNAEIKRITLWINGEENAITPKTIIDDNSTFSYNDIELLATEYIYDLSPDGNGPTLKIKEIPFQLKKRIQEVMHDNRKPIGVKKMGKDFNI